MTVFQRIANYAVPLGNAPIAPEQQRWNADNWRTVRARVANSVADTPYPTDFPSALAVSADERQRIYDGRTNAAACASFCPASQRAGCLKQSLLNAGLPRMLPEWIFHPRGRPHSDPDGANGDSFSVR